jgi:hypothetical protein
VLISPTAPTVHRDRRHGEWRAYYDLRYHPPLTEFFNTRLHMRLSCASVLKSAIWTKKGTWKKGARSVAPHVGWQPHRLREWRAAHGLALESAGERLRIVAEENGLPPLAANFQTLWQHEQGKVYPGPNYRRAYCLMYGASEAELGFRPALPGEAEEGLQALRSWPDRVFG